MKINAILSSLLVAMLVTLSADAMANATLSVNGPVNGKDKAAQDSQPAEVEKGVAGNYLSGQFSRTRGNIDEAIKYMREVHDKSPDDMSVSIQLQGMLLLEGEFDEALELAQDIEDSDTKDPLSDLLLVLYEIKTGDLDEAESILQDSNEGGSVQLWVPLLSGWVDVSRHKLLKPLTVESLGVDVGRAIPLVNYHLALINSQGGFKDAAAENFKDAIEDPRNPPERIIRMLLKFYAQNNSPEVLTPIVKAYGEAHPGAVSELNAPFIATPRDGIAEVLYTMGGIMYGAGVINDAAIYLQLAAYVKPDMDEAVIALGDAYAELKQYDKSNAAYAKISSQSPLYAKAQLHIAVNYERVDKLAESLKRLDAMAKSSPYDADIFVTKADLLRIHSRFHEAVETYSKALRLIPQASDDAWAVLFARASCLDRLGKWPDAEKDLRQALLDKPDQPDVLNYLGFGLLEHGETISSAKDMIAKAVQARPNDAQIIDSMGWVLYLQGDYKDATGYLEKAVELLPGDPTVNDHLGDAYWRLGRKTEARFQWERSLSFLPEEKMVNSINKKIKEGLPPSAALSAGMTNINGKPLMAGTP